jgi:hypothetical protein
MGSYGPLLGYGAIQTGLSFLNQDMSRRQANTQLDTQMNWANQQAERNRGWTQSDIAAQNAFNTGLLDRSIDFQTGLAEQQRGWQMEDRDWLAKTMGGMQEGLQSRIMAENARLAEQARNQYLQDVAHYENFWKNNAYPTQEKITAAQAANQASLNQTRDTAERKFFSDASARGLRGGALSAGMQNIESDYSNRYKEMVNALTQFKNTPQWTPANTLAGYQNMPQANAVPFPNLSMGSYPTAGSNVNFGIAAQNSLPNYPTQGLSVPSYYNAAAGISNAAGQVGGAYLTNYYRNLFGTGTSKSNENNIWPDQFRY